MRYWDSSALLPLLITEGASARLEETYRDDPAIVTWWGTRVECASAICRLERDGVLDTSAITTVWNRLRAAAANWVEVPATEDVREQAMRLLRVHRLRAADALQVAAAIQASDFQPGALEFVTLDERQADAARREGFPLL